MGLEGAGRKHPVLKKHFPLVVARFLPFCFEEMRLCPACSTLTDPISQTGMSQTHLYPQLRCRTFLR